MFQRTDLSRLFLFLDNEIHSCAPSPVYVDCVEVDGVSRSLGELTVAYSPDAAVSGEFSEDAAFFTSKDRATSTITLRAPLEQETVLADTYRRKCSFDAHLNIGLCSDAASINQFSKKEIWEDAMLTSLTQSPVSSPESGNIQIVTEKHGVSIKNRYIVLNPEYVPSTALDSSEFGNDAASLLVPPARCCGCRPGQVALVGSGNNNGMIAYTYNGGLSWDCLSTGSAALLHAGLVHRNAFFFDAIGNGYRIGLSGRTINDRETFTTPPLIGFVSDGNRGVVLVSVGKVYLMDAALEFTQVYDNTAELLPIYDAVYGAGFVIIDVQNAVLWSNNEGKRWYNSLPFALVSDSTPSAIAIRGPGNWLVSADDGRYMTDDYGHSWSKVSGIPFPGPLCVATRHVIMSAGWDPDSGSVRVFRSTDGNASWYEEPNQMGATLIKQGLLPSRLLTAPEDPNIVWIAGYNPGGSPVVIGRP